MYTYVCVRWHVHDQMHVCICLHRWGGIKGRLHRGGGYWAEFLRKNKSPPPLHQAEQSFKAAGTASKKPNDTRKHRVLEGLPRSLKRRVRGPRWGDIAWDEVRQERRPCCENPSCHTQASQLCFVGREGPRRILNRRERRSALCLKRKINRNKLLKCSSLEVGLENDGGSFRGTASRD